MSLLSSTFQLLMMFLDVRSPPFFAYVSVGRKVFKFIVANLIVLRQRNELLTETFSKNFVRPIKSPDVKQSVVPNSLYGIHNMTFPTVVGELLSKLCFNIFQLYSRKLLNLLRRGNSLHFFGIFPKLSFPSYLSQAAL